MHATHKANTILSSRLLTCGIILSHTGALGVGGVVREGGGGALYPL